MENEARRGVQVLSSNNVEELRAFLNEMANGAESLRLVCWQISRMLWSVRSASSCVIPMQLNQRGKEMVKKILRLPVVLDRTGLSRSTVYLRVTEGRFPRPVSLGARAVGWIETEVEEWIARQIEVSRDIRGQRTVVSPLSSR